MELVTGLSFLKTASDLIKGIKESLAARDVKPNEVLDRIIEIQNLISDGRVAVIDAQEQLAEKNRTIQALQDEIRRLQEQLSKRRQGHVHDNAVWRVLDEGVEEGPYCPNCFEKTGTFIQPHRGPLNDGLVSFFCTDHGAKNFRFLVPVRLCGELPSDRPKNRPTPMLRSDYPMR
jgi:hypothetical protein